MKNPITAYAQWLHTRWPAGRVEPLPDTRADGATRVRGLYIVGDLTGVPLLKFAADSGARVIERIAPRIRSRRDQETLDVAIIGAGVAGMAAAMAAKARGLRFAVYEASAPLATLHNFPARKPIFTYPTAMVPAGPLQFHARSEVKEGLIADLEAQVQAAGIEPIRARVSHVQRKGGLLQVIADGHAPQPAQYVVVAIGRSGEHRRLGVPGEDLPHVFNRLHDPAPFADRRVVVVGGGDSAAEAAIALVQAGAQVTMVCRSNALVRPKPENIRRLHALAKPKASDATSLPTSDLHVDTPTDGMEAPATVTSPAPPPSARLDLALGTRVASIEPRQVNLVKPGGPETRPVDAVFLMIGRQPPLAFFRRSGVPIRGEWRWPAVAGLVAFLAICIWLFHWKAGAVHIAAIPGLNWLGHLGQSWQERGWFPYGVPDHLASLHAAFADPANLLGTIRISLGEAGFYYALLYTAIVVGFGVARIRRRRTPYVRAQTLTLMAIQVVPLFLLPYFILPWMGHLGWFDSGIAGSVADALMPRTDYGHGREYWRAFGLILAWPLFIWNVFTSQPLWAWLAISAVQTFVIIPAIVYIWGKGAYCGWICSCGALAETLGDTHRQKMPHGIVSNRLNMIGQAFLLFALVLLALRVTGWILGPGSWATDAFTFGLKDLPILNYVWFVDLLWAGILGVGLYFWYSGRVWCRFACPLAALMHIYARFSTFRILAEKEKCISCNVCTAVCHQGIDVMNFANKGAAVEDPQCVRCSACVQSCPTGVLSFGRIDRRSGEVIGRDRLAASPVRMVELTVGQSR